MDLVAFVVLIGLLLSYGNGANDNIKGVATILGSRTTSYRQAIGWATATTALGSVAAVFLARELLAAFSGKGLVPPAVAGDPSFTISVALAAGLTVLLATRLGFPISTTHALIGGLVGAGLIASPQGINTGKLGSGFMLPLLTSPIIAIALAVICYPVLSLTRRKLGVEEETCVCVGETVVEVVPGRVDPAEALAIAAKTASVPTVTLGDKATCHVRYQGRGAGLDARTALDAAHFLSSGVVSFARGLNDTPKIAALLLVGSLVSPALALIAVGVAMAAGGLISARRVAKTMSFEVTSMNPGQGFTANIITGVLVVCASRLGLPVSTTHVSCGSLFGIGAVTRQARWGVIGKILLAWIITLPMAAALASLTFLCVR